MANVTVEPKIVALEDLLDQIADGRLRVPRFQREFVWSRTRMLQLLDSVRRRYPMGSMLLWSTPQRYQSFGRVGPIAVPVDEPAEPATVSYLLDGHQRLSTLFGTLRLGAAEVKGDDRAFRVFYDLDEEVFCYVRSPEPHHLPVRLLLDNIALLDFSQELLSSVQPRERADRLVKRAKAVSSAFTNYRVAVTQIEGASLDEAVKIFGRLNSTAVRVKPGQLFSALTYHEGKEGPSFDFAGEARAALAKLPEFHGIDLNTVLRCLLAALGEDIYETSWQEVSDRHKGVLRSTMEESLAALARSIEFMRERIGAASSRAVPYALQIVLLSEFFRNCAAPSEEQYQKLEAWIWGSSFSGAFTVGSSLTFNEAVKAARRLAEGDVSTLGPFIGRPYPRTFHPRAARVRAFFLFLKALKPRSLETGTVIPPADLLKRGMADAVLVSPERRHSNVLANRLLLGRGVGSKGARLKELLIKATSSLFWRDIFDSHVIPVAAVECLATDDYQGFVTLRERALIEREREFAGKYVRLPDIEAEEEPELNDDDDGEGDELL